MHANARLRGGDPLGRGEPLRHRHHPDGRDAPVRPGDEAAVADARGERRQQDARGAPGGEGAPARWPAPDHYEPQRADEGVDPAIDAFLDALESGAPLEECVRVADAAGLRGLAVLGEQPDQVLPSFPPPPDAYDEWRDILERHPDLEPATQPYEACSFCLPRSLTSEPATISMHNLAG
jgi:hypothetical protein